MNQFYSNLKLMLVALFAFVGINAWADDAYYTLDTSLEAVETSNNGYATSGDATVGDITWTFQGNGKIHPWRLGGKSLSDADRAAFTKTSMDRAISSIDLTVGTAADITVNSLKLVVASDADFTSVLDEVTKEFVASSTITFTPTSGESWAKEAYYKFVFNVSVENASKNKFVEFSKVEFFAVAEEGPTVARPVITPNGGTFLETQEVTFSCETEGAAIYYTIDGSDPANGNEPSGSATRYERTLRVTQNTTVRAVAFKDGAKSAEATATFTQIQSYSSFASMSGLESDTPFNYTGSAFILAKPTAKYVYIYDGSNFSLIYDATGEKTAAAEKGKYITPGWMGKVSIYKKLFELVPDEAIVVNSDPVQPVNYPAIALGSAVQNQVFTLADVTSYSVSGKNIYITVNNEDKDISEAQGVYGYNKFGIEIPAFEEGKTYEIVGAIGCNDDQVQFWPISIQEETEPGPEPEIGFYVTGTMCEWGIVEANKMELNEELVGKGTKEFSLTLPLVANAQIKVVASYDGSTPNGWFPAGEAGSGNKYVVPSDGTYTVYCRPNGDGDETWIDNCLKVVRMAAPVATQNAGFEESEESNAIGIRTYQKDVKGEEVAQMQEVTGWTIVENGDARAAGVFAYGSESFLGGEGYVAPAAQYAFEEGATKALGMVAVWTADLQYTQVVNLAPGNYMLQVPVYNAGGADAVSANKIGADGTFASATQFPVGQWTVLNVEFTVEATKDVTISLGYVAANSGSGAMPHLFIESAKLYSGDENISAAKAEADLRCKTLNAIIALDKAKETKLAALNALVPGEGLFQYDAQAINLAKEAVVLAETVEAVEAVAMPTPTQPDAKKQYTFQLKEGGKYMAVNEGIKLSDTACPFSFVAVEGGWALKNGDAYVANTGNAWTMSMTADPYAWKVSSLGEGYYTLAKASNAAQLIGINVDAEAVAGTPCYADKGEGDKSTWAIAEYVAPTYTVTISDEIQNGTVEATPTEAAAGETVSLTAKPAEGYELVSFKVEGVNSDIEVVVGEDHVFIMPDDDVIVSATFAAATPKPISFKISKTSGQYYNGSGEAIDTGWGAKWVSTQENPQLTLVASSGINVSNGMHFGPAGVDYTLSVSDGYVITGYALTASNLPDGSSTLTPEGGEGQAFVVGTPNAVSDLNAQTVKFQITEGRVQISDFEVTVEKYVAPAQYTVTISDEIANGTVVAEPAIAEAGTTIQLTVTPADGYQLDRMEVLAANGNVVEVTDNAFTMPAADVRVFATFKKALAAGNYYLRNVATGLYWGYGNNWGTRASLMEHGDYVTLAKLEDGTYSLESRVSNGGTAYYFEGDYMDNATPDHLTITQVGENYTISGKNGFYGYDGTSTVLGKNLDAASEKALWAILTKEQLDAELAAATVEAPVDATYLIRDPNFSRNHRELIKVANNDWQGCWTMVAANQNLSGGEDGNGSVGNNCAESYHSTFTLSQVVAGAPKGVYAMTAQAFYRQDGSDNDNLPVFYANEATATFPVKAGSENSMTDAGKSFKTGAYTIDPIFVKVDEDATLTVGAKLETNTNLWCIWDNFVLTYYGDCDINEAKFAGLNAEVKALRQEATELNTNEDVSGVTKTTLEAALRTTEEIEPTEEGYNTAIATLKTAIAQANLDVKNKPAIAAMYALIESTNFYTAEALTAYKGEADGYKEAYEAGTLTTTVDNIATVHGWRDGNTADDFLLSAWTINDVQAKDFDTNLYINTWSTEGENDGTEFKVPFFEYWTNDANSLGAAKLTATMTELPAGFYTVDAWIRVRGKNNFEAPATGITADVNGGEAVDVCAGEAVEGTNFFLAKFTAAGRVGEDGVLKFNVNVAENNNISWLSFKNVKYAAKDETEYAYEQALASIEDGKSYRVFTEVNENRFYLNTTGYLVADVKKAATFTLNKVSGDAYPTGVKFTGVAFTNPATTEADGKGDPKNEGHIKTNISQNRNTWEAQVFFLKDGKYAVRATNANSENWGANTYWDVLNTEAALPEAGYALEAAYVWQIEANVDNRSAAYEKAQKWAAKLQAIEGLVTDASQWTTNAQESSEGPIKDICDGNIGTHFHSQWSGTGPDADHYIEATLPEAAQKFHIAFYKRNDNNRPTSIVVSAGDAEPAQTITEGLPAPAWYSAEVDLGADSDVIRFTVTNTSSPNAKNNGHVFFTFGEFYILPCDELTDAACKYIVSDYTDIDPAFDPAEVETLDAQIETAYQQALLKEELADLAACIERAKEFVAAYPAADAEALVQDATTALERLGNGEYTTKEEIASAKSMAITTVQLFVAAAGAPSKDTDVTEWFVVNPTPVAHKAIAEGWEGDAFGDSSDGVSEYWNKAAVGFHQTLTLPAGDYCLTGVALQRTGMTGYIYAGEVQTTIAQVSDSEVNSRAQASSWFAAGNGVNEVKFTMAEAGDVVIGLTTDKDNGDHWTVWQSFKIEKLAPVPAVVLNAPTWSAAEGTQAEPTMLAADEVLKITYTADNLEENGYNAEDLKVKVTVMVSGDLPENVMNMQSETKHSVRGEFYINLGEVDFPVELKAGYVYQNIAVFAAQLVVPAAAGGEEKVVATYAGAPAQLHWIAKEAAPESVKYAGVIEQTVMTPDGAQVGETTVTDQTVTFSEAGENKVNITFNDGFTWPIGMDLSEFTIEGVDVNVNETDQSFVYSFEGTVSVPRGMISVNYNVTLQGVQADENATPVFFFTMTQGGPVNNIYFGADADAIAAYKQAVGIKDVKGAQNVGTIYDLSGRKVEKMVKGGIYIVNGKKVSFK